MLNILEYLYSEPKWQAKLTDESKFFVCQDGTRIDSLIGLRETLMSASEETLNSMVSDDYNYLASWVADAIGDSTLAAELQSRTARWELLSALESHMIRNLALPSYLAGRWLRNGNSPFVINNLVRVNNLYEAKEMLEKDGNNELYVSLKHNKHDFINWVRYSVGDYMLADMIEETENIEKINSLVIDHVEMLITAEKSAHGSCECGNCDACKS